MFKALDNNYKNCLLEITARHFGVETPQYIHFDYGPAHAKVFRCICCFQDQITSGEGRTKVEAEQFASREMLNKVQKLFFKRSGLEWLFSQEKQSNTLSRELLDALGNLKVNPHFDVYSLYGDAVLRYWIARYLFDHYPYFQEGILTKIIAQALKNETRAMIAKNLSLEEYVRTECTTRILAETLSAIVGKLILTVPEENLKSTFMEHYQPFIDHAAAIILKGHISKEAFISASQIQTKVDNFKNKLQEYAQKRGLRLPTYTLIEKEGPDHAPTFTIQCTLRGFTDIGIGKTRISAEQEAAQKVLTLVDRFESSQTRIVGRSNDYIVGSSKEENSEIPNVELLKTRIGWPYFTPKNHLMTALTHPSYHSEDNYQRLEFLGDAILKKILIAYLLKTYPEQTDKAFLSPRVDDLVSAETQARIARNLSINRYMLTLTTPITSAMLSDVLEAIIAAIYLDTEERSDRQAINQAATSAIISWFKPDIYRILGKPKNPQDDGTSTAPQQTNKAISEVKDIPSAVPQQTIKIIEVKYVPSAVVPQQTIKVIPEVKEELPELSTAVPQADAYQDQRKVTYASMAAKPMAPKMKIATQSIFSPSPAISKKKPLPDLSNTHDFPILSSNLNPQPKK